MVDWKKGLLSTAIAIIFVFFILQGVYTFWDEPKWDEFCNEQFARPFPEKLITDESVCNEVFKANANIENQCNKNKGYILYEKDENGCQKAIECSSCNKDFDTARDSFQRTVFIISIVIGLLALIGGLFARPHALGTGLMGGGILLMIIGTLQYWHGLQDYAQFIILGIVLAILIYIAQRKFTK